LAEQWREQQPKNSLLDFETLQKTNVFGEQTAAARSGQEWHHR